MLMCNKNLINLSNKFKIGQINVTRYKISPNKYFITKYYTTKNSPHITCTTFVPLIQYLNI